MLIEFNTLLTFFASFSGFEVASPPEGVLSLGLAQINKAMF